jgi:tRNA U34 5-carboxymethylaminomethyl modifying GTPase MnmE/TrmE
MQIADNKRLIVSNKADLPAAWRRDDAVEVSAVTGFGLNALRQRIVRALDVEALTDRPEMTNVRHIALVQRAHEALIRARKAAGAEIAVRPCASGGSGDGEDEALSSPGDSCSDRDVNRVGTLSEEFVLADLQDARVALEEVSGRRAPEELLAHIFSRFCIGK